MERYQDYKIYVDPPKMDDFITKLMKKVKDMKWDYRDDIATFAEKTLGNENRKIICIETSKIPLEGSNLKSMIWMWKYRNKISVFNIIPLKKYYLDIPEYNYVLDYFDKQIICSLKDYVKKVELSKPYFDIYDVATPDSVNKLRMFSETANKSTGFNHPLDFDKWCDFVISSYLSEKKIRPSDLLGWLTDRGWSEEKANELSKYYEYSLDLLGHYGNNK